MFANLDRFKRDTIFLNSVGLNQRKVLPGHGLTSLNAQSLEPNEKRDWKCVPRKRQLIGSAEKMLCIPDPTYEGTSRTRCKFENRNTTNYW